MNNKQVNCIKAFEQVSVIEVFTSMCTWIATTQKIDYIFKAYGISSKI